MKSTMLILLEKMANIESRQHSIEVELIDYMESSAPKSSDQWQEERLRALEEQVKSSNYLTEQHEYYDAFCKATESKVAELEGYIKNLEEQINSTQQSKDVRIAKLENTVAELALALGNLSRELQDMNNAKNS